VIISLDARQHGGDRQGVAVAKSRAHGCARIDSPLVLGRRRGVGRRGGWCGDRGLEPPASVFFGTDLIHRAYHGQTFHAAASVRARASGRASLTPVAAPVVIAIRVQFALSFDGTRQRRIEEPLRRRSSPGEFHLGGNDLPGRSEGARGPVIQSESQHRARIERFRQRERDDSRGIARPRLTVGQRQVPRRLAGLVYPQLQQAARSQFFGTGDDAHLNVGDRRRKGPGINQDERDEQKPNPRPSKG